MVRISFRVPPKTGITHSASSEGQPSTYCQIPKRRPRIPVPFEGRVQAGKPGKFVWLEDG
jgi:hypothetical protein